MKKVKNGYAFQVAVSHSGLVGIKEDFKISIHAKKFKVNLLVGVGIDYKPVIPAVFRQGELVSLNRVLSDEEDKEQALVKFIRSNKATYSVLDSVFLVCAINGVYNMETGDWDEESEVSFYTPSTVAKGTESSYLVCSELNSRVGVDTVVVNDVLLQNGKNIVLRSLADSISDRCLYLGTRLGVYA